MMKNYVKLLLLIVAFSKANAQPPSYRTLPAGLLGLGMSPSGTLITGYNNSGCFVYKTVDSTVTNIGGVEAWGVTDAGQVGGIDTGTTPFGPAEVASIYTPSLGWVDLPTAPGGGYVTGTSSYSHVYGIADNGESVCGMYWVNGGKTTAFIYNVTTGYTSLQDAGSSARANCISGDGLVAGGWWQAASRVGICWYPAPSGNIMATYGESFGTNSTGTYIAGYDNSGIYTKAILWDRVNSSTIIIPLPSGIMEGQAMAVSDSMVTVGYSGNAFGSSGFIYIPGQGSFDLQSYLTGLGATNVGNCGMPLAISRNGRYICGVTSGFPRQSWFVDLGSSATNVPVINVKGTTVSAYPNPVSNGVVRISYNQAAAGAATVSVFDLQGRKIRNLGVMNMNAGVNDFSWDLSDDSGMKVASGSYIVAIESAGSVSRTTVIVR